MRLIRKQILGSDECYATTALAIFISEFGWDALDWMPETIKREMESIYGRISPATFNRLMVGIQLLTSDDFYRLLKRFIDYTNILVHGHLDDLVADVGEIVWALTEAKIIDDPGRVEDPLRLFSSDVYQYIELAFNNSGLVFPPEIFKEFGLLFTDKAVNNLESFADNPPLFEIMHSVAQYHTELVNAAQLEKLKELQAQLVQCGFPELVFQTPISEKSEEVDIRKVLGLAE